MKITAQLDRRLAPDTANSDRYLRVQVIAPDSDEARTRLPLNLALVIDRSGSMAGTKLEKAKEAAIFCLRNLTGADRAAIVTYDDEVRILAPSRPLTPETKNKLISEIRGIYSGGSTNLGGGWLAGAQQVADHLHNANYLNRVILLSDGLANVGIVSTEELAHHASELRLRGVATTTMGIGADFNEELLEKMAIKGGGHFYFIEDARQIPDFLHRELGEVLSTSARSVSLQLDTPEGIHAHLLNNFEVDRAGKRFTVRLDDAIAGEVRALVFKLSVRPASRGTTLPLPLLLRWTEVSTGTQLTAASSEAALTYAEERECHAEAPNSEVLEDAALLEAALAREEALRYDASGDYARSAGRLAQAASFIRQVAPASPVAAAEALTLEGEVSQAASGLGAIKRKAMHYSQNTRRQSRRE